MQVNYFGSSFFLEVTGCRIQDGLFQPIPRVGLGKDGVPQRAGLASPFRGFLDKENDFFHHLWLIAAIDSSCGADL